MAIGYRLILGVFVSIAGSTISVANAQLIDGRFQIMDEGQTVKDVKTNLIWTRCSIGQANTGDTCKDSPRPETWNDAIATGNTLNAGSGYAGAKNWRLPTIAEWAALRDCSKVSASTNTKTVTVFGKTKTINEVMDVPTFSLRSNNSIIHQKCPMATSEEIFPNSPRGQGIYLSSTNLAQVNKGTAELFPYNDAKYTALTIHTDGGFIGTLDMERANAYIRYVRTRDDLNNSGF